MKVLIVEDEINAQKVLIYLLREFCPELNLVGIATGIVKAKKLIKQHKPDLVFLDVKLEDGTGLELLQQIKNIDFDVVFTTAYDNYAIQAIKFGAVDYLLKPIDPDELKEAVLRIKQKKEKEQTKLSKNLTDELIDEQTISIKTSNKTYLISVCDIIRLEADGAYTNIITIDQNVIASKNLKFFEDVLPQNLFIRTHQSHLVNKNHIKTFHKTGNLEMSNQEMIPVSFRKKSIVRNVLKNKNDNTY